MSHQRKSSAGPPDLGAGATALKRMAASGAATVLLPVTILDMVFASEADDDLNPPSMTFDVCPLLLLNFLLCAACQFFCVFWL